MRCSSDRESRIIGSTGSASGIFGNHCGNHKNIPFRDTVMYHGMATRGRPQQPRHSRAPSDGLAEITRDEYYANCANTPRRPGPHAYTSMSQAMPGRAASGPGSSRGASSTSNLSSCEPLRRTSNSRGISTTDFQSQPIGRRSWLEQQARPSPTGIKKPAPKKKAKSPHPR